MPSTNSKEALDKERYGSWRKHCFCLYIMSFMLIVTPCQGCLYAYCHFPHYGHTAYIHTVMWWRCPPLFSRAKDVKLKYACCTANVMHLITFCEFYLVCSVTPGRCVFWGHDGCVCFRRQKSADSAGSDEEDVDELSLIDHKEIMSRITLKQEVSRRPPLMLCFLGICCDRTVQLQHTKQILSCLSCAG